MTEFTIKSGNWWIEINICLTYKLHVPLSRCWISIFVNILWQNSRHFLSDIFKHIFSSKNIGISILISRSVFCSIDTSVESIEIIAWCRSGDKPLSELMMTTITQSYASQSCCSMINAFWASRTHSLMHFSTMKTLNAHNMAFREAFIQYIFSKCTECNYANTRDNFIDIFFRDDVNLRYITINKDMLNWKKYTA